VNALFAQAPLLLVAACLVLGLLVGSFLNVVIYRLPVMLERQWAADSAAANQNAAKPNLKPEPAFDLLRPRSCCPKCRAPIKSWQNIPVVSWLLLRGQCAACSAPISARYPLVELLTGLLSALVAWNFGYHLVTVHALVITWILIALSFIDVDHQLLPDALTLPLLWLGLVASATAKTSDALPADLKSAVLGAAAGYVSLWSVYQLFKLATGKEGMGYGDFKLLAALGAWLGWQMLLPIVLLSAAAGAVLGLTLIALRRHEMGRQLPFGPYLAVAGFLVMLWGPQWVARYLGLFAS
jgi:leader peptidase (prepilin peptidase)/N-methyltransferase